MRLHEAPSATQAAVNRQNEHSPEGKLNRLLLACCQPRSVLGSQLPSQQLTALYYLVMDVVMLSQYAYYQLFYRQREAVQARALQAQNTPAGRALRRQHRSPMLSATTNGL